MAARQLAVVGTIFWIIERRYNPDFLGHARRWGPGCGPQSVKLKAGEAVDV